MRIAYLDCFAGIAGDMFLGALIDAGVPPAVLQEATDALHLNASLRVETVDRSGISCTKVHVLEGTVLAEEVHSHSHSHSHSHAHADGSVTTSHAAVSYNGTHTVQPQTQHLHKTGHAHTHAHAEAHSRSQEQEAVPEQEHGHAHVHGRSLTVIRELIQAAPLDNAVKQLSIRAFELLGRSEAKIHNVPVDQIHFHEVGAVDAIVDMVAASAGIVHLQIGAWYSSAVNVGGGMVECAHGTFPVPAPATADLLRDCPTYSAHVQKELVTPTGAALLRALAPAFGPQPAMRVEKIGYGAGTRNPRDFPNVLRLSIGEATETASVPQTTAFAEAAQGRAAAGSQPATQHSATHTVTVIETALDDLSPQIIAYVAEQALAQGALDVMLTPVLMKKGRPGTLLTLLCEPSNSGALQQLLLRETSTLGLRIRQEQRTCLERTHTSVGTAYGSIRMKIGTENEVVRNAAPEFEDCRAAAAEHNVPLKQVQQAALAAYFATAGGNNAKKGPSQQ